MSLNKQALLVLSVSSLLLSFTCASAPAPAPETPVSYISLSPSAAPGPAPYASPLPLSKPEPVPMDIKGQVIKMVEKSMEGTLAKTKDFYEDIIKARLEDPASSSMTRECLLTCKEVVEAAMDDMENTIDDVKGSNYYKAEVDLSSVSTNVDTCEQCFEEMVGEDIDIKQFDDWVRGITEDSLGALQQFSS